MTDQKEITIRDISDELINIKGASRELKNLVDKHNAHYAQQEYYQINYSVDRIRTLLRLFIKED